MASAPRKCTPTMTGVGWLYTREAGIFSLFHAAVYQTNETPVVLLQRFLKMLPAGPSGSKSGTTGSRGTEATIHQLTAR